jgi:hypothetical protein
VVEASERLQGLELLVGRVVDVGQHPGARAPSFTLTVDLGRRGRHEATLAGGEYGADDLRGRQIVCALDAGALLVLTAHSHARGLVLLHPEREVEDGSIVA